MENKVEIEEFKWEPPVSSANIGPTFYITTDKLFILLQMIYSTVNTWSPSIQLTARVYGQDGTKKFSTLSESTSNFITSDDLYSASCGPMSVTKIDGEKLEYRVKFDTPDLKIDILHTAVSEAFKLGTGQHFYDDNNEEAGYIKSKFIPRANAVGMIILDGQEIDCNGTSCLTFVTQYVPQGIALWNFCNFQSEEHSLMLYQVFIINSFIYLVVARNQ